MLELAISLLSLAVIVLNNRIDEINQDYFITQDEIKEAMSEALARDDLAEFDTLLAIKSNLRKEWRNDNYPDR